MTSVLNDPHRIWNLTGGEVLQSEEYEFSMVATKRGMLAMARHKSSGNFYFATEHESWDPIHINWENGKASPSSVKPWPIPEDDFSETDMVYAKDFIES